MRPRQRTYRQRPRLRWRVWVNTNLQLFRRPPAREPLGHSSAPAVAQPNHLTRRQRLKMIRKSIFLVIHPRFAASAGQHAREVSLASHRGDGTQSVRHRHCLFKAEAEALVKRKWTARTRQQRPYLELRSRILQACAGLFERRLTWRFPGELTTRKYRKPYVLR